MDVHLNLNVRGLEPSATIAINERCNRLREEGTEVFRLGLGQSPFPVPRPVVEELQANAFRKDYLEVRGLGELRRAIADYYDRVQRVHRSADDVLVGPGSKELMFLLQLVYYGDLVVPSPAWVSYAPQAHIIGRKVHWLETSPDEGWRLTPRRLSELCERDPDRPRIVVLNYPSNPTGLTYTVKELKELARAARRYRVVLLSDEIYGELHYRGRHVSIARFYPEGTIISGGLSKWCGAGGWRLGSFVFPPSMRWLLDSIAAVASETFTATSAPIQYAAVRAFQGSLRIEEYLWNVRRILQSLGRSIARRMQRFGVEVPLPEGGFYLFPDFRPLAGELSERGIVTGPEFCERLLRETGVAFLPGSDFGRPEPELTARLAFVDFDGARALAALDALPPTAELKEDYLQTYCGRVLEAVERLGRWLGKAS